MDTRQKLDTELKDALRSGDESRKQNIRMILSAIRLSEVEKGQKLDDAAVLTIIQKEVKSRVEAMEDAQKAKRTDLIDRALSDIQYLETYLPRQLSEDELALIINQVVNEIGAKNPSDMGKVMKALLPKVQGQATGDLVSKLVKKALQP